MTTSLKILACLTVVLLAAALFFVSGGGWLIFLLLFLPSYLCEEWLSMKLFGEQSPLNRLSIAEAGFSVWRILLGVIVVLMLFGLAVSAVYGINSLVQLFGMISSRGGAGLDA